MKNTEKELSFLDHLEVLRWHLLRAGSSILIFATLAFIYKDFVFDQVLLAPMNSNFPTYIFFCNLSEWLSLGDLLCFGDYNWNLNNFTISGQIAAHIIISLFAGLVIAFPYVFWELWRFIKPALYVILNAPRHLIYTVGWLKHSTVFHSMCLSIRNTQKVHLSMQACWHWIIIIASKRLN